MRIPALYPILDTESLARKNCAAETVAKAWLDAGAGILQFRHKGHWPRPMYAEAQRIAGMCREHDALFIVDDRADFARLLDAGLHVGQDDLAPAEARRIIGPDAVLGFSSHNAEQLCAAVREPVTYVAFGPVFPTRSKLKPDPVVGLAELRRCREFSGKPLVAIGGITRENARSVFDAGADAVAVIADLLPEQCSAESLRARIEEWQRLLH